MQQDIEERYNYWEGTDKTIIIWKYNNCLHKNPRKTM